MRLAIDVDGREAQVDFDALPDAKQMEAAVAAVRAQRSASRPLRPAQPQSLPGYQLRPVAPAQPQGIGIAALAGAPSAASIPGTSTGVLAKPPKVNYNPPRLYPDSMIPKPSKPVSRPVVVNRQTVEPSDFNGLPFDYDSFMQGINGTASVIRTRDNGQIPLSQAMRQVTKKTGIQSFEGTKSPSQVEQEQATQAYNAGGQRDALGHGPKNPMNEKSLFRAKTKDEFNRRSADATKELSDYLYETGLPDKVVGAALNLVGHVKVSDEARKSIAKSATDLGSGLVTGSVTFPANAAVEANTVLDSKAPVGERAAAGANLALAAFGPAAIEALKPVLGTLGRLAANQGAKGAEKLAELTSALRSGERPAAIKAGIELGLDEGHANRVFDHVQETFNDFDSSGNPVRTEPKKAADVAPVKPNEETRIGPKVQGPNKQVVEATGGEGPQGVSGVNRAQEAGRGEVQLPSQKGQERVASNSGHSEPAGTLPENLPAPPETTSLAMAQRAKEAQALGTSKPEPVKQLSNAEAHAKGKASVESGEVNPYDLAQKLGDDNRAAKPEEYGALLEGRRRLLQEIGKTQKAVEDAVGKPEHPAALSAYEAAKENAAEFDGHLDKIKGASGGSLQSLKVGTTIDEGDFAQVVTEARRIRGEALSPRIEAQLKASVTAHQEALKKISDLEERLAKVNTAKEVRKIGRKLSAADLDAEYADLQKSLVKSSAQLSAGVDPAALQTVGKMVVNRIRRGGVSASQAIDDVFTTVKGHVTGLTRNDVQKAAADLHEATTAANRARAAADYKARQTALAVQAQLKMLKPKSLAEKVVSGIRDVTGIPRTLKTSFDLSAPLRQAAILTVNNPKLGAKAFGAQLKAFKDPVFSHKYNTAILEGPNAHLYRKANLYLSDSESATISRHEEEFVSRLAGKVPGVKGSERAYTTYLNTMRAGMFDAMHVPGMSEKEIRGIANYINVATGRGNLGGLEHSANGIAQILFSPRNLASRFQLLTLQPLRKAGSVRVGKQIAKQYATFAGTVLGVMKLAEASGAQVNYTNPDDPDWMKIKIGDTRIDMLAGLQQAARFAFRFAGSKGDERKMVEVTKQFAKSKLAPTPGYLYSAYTGKDYKGQPFSPSDTGKDVLTPLIAQDTFEAMRAQGIPKGLALGILSGLGVGVSTYNKNQKDQNIYDAGYEAILGKK